MPVIRWLGPVVAVLVVLGLAAHFFGKMLILLAFAALLATGLHPVVQFLEGRGLSHRLAVPLTFVGVLGAIAGVLFVLFPPLIDQATALFRALPGYAAALPSWGQDWEHLRDRLGFLPSVTEITAWLSGQAGGYLRSLLGWSGRVAGLVASAASVALLLYYMLSDAHLFRNQFLRLVPPYRRDETATLLTLITHRVGRYTLGTMTDMTIVALLNVLGLWLVGLPNALMLGVLIGLFNIIPFIGATLGSIPALIVAFGISPQTGFMALAVILIVQQLEGYVIYPRVVGNAVGLHPLYVLIALTAGSQVLGVAGVFLGIPTAVIIKTLLEAWVLPKIEQIAPQAQESIQLATSPAEPVIPLVSIDKVEGAPTRGGGVP